MSIFTNSPQAYSDYRPRYPQQLIADLCDRTVGDHAEHLVDWGCGTGELTIPLSRRFARVTAIDVHDGMIAVARSNAQRKGVGNVEWIVGRAEDFEIEPDSCDLIVSGSAFHWMDRDLLAKCAFRGLRRGAAFALVGGGGRNVWKATSEWHVVALECLKKHVSEPPPRPEWKHDPTRGHGEFLAPAGFRVEKSRYSAEYSWGAEEIAGYLYSISLDLPLLLGDRREAFEHDLREALARANPSGAFQERFDFYLMIAEKP